MRNKRVAAVNDLAGFGRSSLAVIMPILSAMGLQCCPVPTAVLSSHMAIKGYTFLDMTENLRKTISHWKSAGIKFDAIYTGFLGSAEQVPVVCDALKNLKDENALLVVDPVMGDNGKPYKSCTQDLINGMRELAFMADILVPNETEAMLLLDRDASNISSESAAENIVRELSSKGPLKVVLTGLSIKPGAICSVCFDRNADKCEFIYKDRIGGYFPGTGDIFASVLTGAFLCGKDIFESAKTAADFVKACAEETLNSGEAPIAGVLFERLLPKLIDRM